MRARGGKMLLTFLSSQADKKPKRKYEPPVPTRVGKRKKHGPSSAAKLPPGNKQKKKKKEKKKDEKKKDESKALTFFF
jgi:hypothetical protein